MAGGGAAAATPSARRLSPSDRDKAPLHKVAGRNQAGAQHHRTCQQPHWAAGTNSSPPRLPASFFPLPLAVYSFSHSFIPPSLSDTPSPPVSFGSLLVPALPLDGVRRRRLFPSFFSGSERRILTVAPPPTPPHHLPSPPGSGC